MADVGIQGLDEYEGSGPIPDGALFIAHNPTSGYDRRVPANRLPVPAAQLASLTPTQLFALLKAGDGVTISLETGGVRISSSLTTAPAPDQPSAPTNGLVDDVGDTFSFLPTAAYPGFFQYKVAGLPAITGAVVLDATNSYVQNGRVYVKVVGAVPTGGLAVYVAGSGSIPDGKPLFNNKDFTGTAVTPSPTLTAALAISVATIVAGNPLTYTVTPAGGTSPYTYSVIATNNATGQPIILGTTATGTWTPQTAGSYNVDATVTDSSAPAKTAQATTRTVQVTAAGAAVTAAQNLVTTAPHGVTYDAQAAVTQWEYAFMTAGTGSSGNTGGATVSGRTINFPDPNAQLEVREGEPSAGTTPGTPSESDYGPTPALTTTNGRSTFQIPGALAGDFYLRPAGRADLAIGPLAIAAATTTPGPAAAPPTTPVTDDSANTFTYTPSGVTVSTPAPTNPSTDDAANTFTYTPATA